MVGKQIIVEGQTATNPQTGEKIVYRSGKWYPLGAGGDGMDTPSAPLTPGSDSRTRVVLGLGPALSAQEDMATAEKGGHNPFTEHPIINTLANSDDPQHHIFGMDLSGIGRQIAPQAWQNYDQASKSFEAAVLPVLSGAAVTPSEGVRQIRANLPQYGDSAETLARKAKNRAQMLNGAADLAGKPRPFPDVGTWDYKGSGTPTPSGGSAGGGATRIRSAAYHGGLSQAQRQAAAAYKGTQAASGSAQNPLIPANDTEWETIPSGSWYLGSDGKPRQKP